MGAVIALRFLVTRWSPGADGPGAGAESDGRATREQGAKGDQRAHRQRDGPIFESRISILDRSVLEPSKKEPAGQFREKEGRFLRQEVPVPCDRKDPAGRNRPEQKGRLDLPPTDGVQD